MDRNNEATLPRTAPRTYFKSSTEDLDPTGLFSFFIQDDYPGKEDLNTPYQRSAPFFGFWYTPFQKDLLPLFNPAGTCVAI